MSDPKVIIALDYSSAAPALALAAKLQPSLCRLKVGKELFTSSGPIKGWKGLNKIILFYSKTALNEFLQIFTVV